MTILAIAVSCAAALAYVLWPVLRPPRGAADGTTSALEQLETPARDR